VPFTLKIASVEGFHRLLTTTAIRRSRRKEKASKTEKLVVSCLLVSTSNFFLALHDLDGFD